MKTYKFVNINLANYDIATNECSWMPNQDRNRKIPFSNVKCRRVLADNNLNLITGIVIEPTHIAYFEDGLQHNLHGPAVVYFDIDKAPRYAYKGYFTDCKTQEEFDQFIKKIVFE